VNDLSIALEDRPGALAEMGEALGRAGLSIEGGGVFGGAAHFLFADGQAARAALEAGVAPSTASSHLTKLTGARIVEMEKQGRHRYFRLADADIAEVLEELTGLAAQLPRKRPGPADPALRLARAREGERAFSAL